MISLIVSGCSAYQSEGRKFLEGQAFEFAGVQAQANLQQCSFELEDATWTFVRSTPEADVFARDVDGVYQLHVKSKAETPSFGCDFAFATVEERFTKSEDAVDLTLQNYVSLPKASVSNP